jgi:hypothetical protein
MGDVCPPMKLHEWVQCWAARWNFFSFLLSACVRKNMSLSNLRNKVCAVKNNFFITQTTSQLLEYKTILYFQENPERQIFNIRDWVMYAHWKLH